MTTIIKRLRVNVQFDIGDSLDCFHTDGEQVAGEPPTSIIYNGHEYEGHIEMLRKNNEFIIIIRMPE